MTTKITWNKFTSFDELPEPEKGRILNLFVKEGCFEACYSFTSDSECWYDDDGDILEHFIKMVADEYINEPTHWTLVNGPEENNNEKN